MSNLPLNIHQETNSTLPQHSGLTELSERVRSRRRALRLTQQNIAHHCGISASAVSQWETGSAERISSEHLYLAAQILECNPEWLATGRGRAQTTAETSEIIDIDACYAPELTWEDALIWAKTQSYDDVQHKRIIPTHNGSTGTFCLTLQDDFMESASTPSYPAGAIIFVDPYVKAESGHCVLAVVNGDDTPVFRKFVRDGSRQYLRALNPAYPTITDPFQIIGKLVGVYLQ